MSEMLIGVFLFPTIPTDMLRFLFVSHAFLLMTEASQLSVEIAGETALYQYRRFSNDCKEGSTNR